MIPFNPLFLIPIVLIGGLCAFVIGRRLFSGKKPESTTPVSVPSPPAVVLPPTAHMVSYEQEVARPRRSQPKAATLAERYEAWGSEAISLEDAQEQSFMALVQLDREQERREKLMGAARKYAKDNALKGAYVDNRSGQGQSSPNV